MERWRWCSNCRSGLPRSASSVRVCKFADAPCFYIAFDVTKMGSMDYHAFLSHASEDKESVARPLADALGLLGLRVWLDELELTVGDSLRQGIDRGIGASKFGIVVLSPAFFRKNWTNLELDGLFARENGSEKVILPVWHEVDRDSVFRYSPMLAGKFAVSTTEGIPKVAEQIYEAITRRRALPSPLKNSVVSPLKREPNLFSSTLRKHITLPQLFPILGILTYVFVALLLFNTQLGVDLYAALHVGRDPYFLGLVISLVILAMLYAFACFFELGFARQFWREIIPQPDVSNLLIAMFISGALCLLVFLTRYPKLLAMAYLLFGVLDFLGSRIYLQIIRDKIQRAERTKASKYSGGRFAALKLFYQGRSWASAHILKIVLSIVAICFAWNEMGHTYFYITLTATIAINEVTFWTWRIVMFRAHGYLFPATSPTDT